MAEKTSIKNCIELYLAACRVGALTFGGGYAMMPILQREVVDRKGWCTEADILDYFAMAQCLPGIIMVNTLSFIGQKRHGPAGAIAAGLGAVTPSLFIILIIAMLLSNFADSAMVQNAFAGVRVCVCVLIFNAVLKLWRNSVIDIPTFILFAGVAGLSFFTNLSPILFVVLSAVIGILASRLIPKKGGEEK